MPIGHATCSLYVPATGVTAETADHWLEAWVLEATGGGLPKDGRYWGAAWEWIAAERAARRPGW